MPKSVKRMSSLTPVRDRRGDVLIAAGVAPARGTVCATVRPDADDQRQQWNTLLHQAMPDGGVGPP